ncbi:hypothetical protein [Terriglobus albidus]|uniref:hypothetical protein n=1 Tax=Terriglobus albidus TaxID=1592106 RepID=UPI0021DF92E4|nr:hypothetical protein [Terriglobus albidus]
MKLNRWVWVGLLASVIWAVAAAVYSYRSDVEQANWSGAFAYKVCTYGKEVTRDKDLSSCVAKREESRAIQMSGSNVSAVFLALGPIPFAWLAAFILLYVVRAQIVGFRAVVPWKSLSARKRGFVALCVVFCLVVVGVSIVWVEKLYVDSQVPVGMSTSLDLSQYGDHVYVSGTWKRTDLIGDTIASPLQTSKIECHKDENRCTEALASVSRSTLMAELVTYDIQSWTPDAIVMRRDYECATELFTIDLNTRAVTGAGHKTNQDQPGCKVNIFDGKETWTYQLVKGFDVYWAFQTKARPFPLSVIQSMFGN